MVIASQDSNGLIFAPCRNKSLFIWMAEDNKSLTRCPTKHSTKMPVITVDDQKVETELKIGPYTGSFTGAGGDSSKDFLLNLTELKTWEDYKRILTDGYMLSALDELPYLDQSVNVYEIKERYAPNDSDAVAPYLNIEFINKEEKDPEILIFGFNGYRYDGTKDLLKSL